METVEVVIKLPKEVYEKIQQIDRIISSRRNGKTIEFALWNGVKNGTVLPKGHGKLKDVDAYRKEMLDSREFDFFKRLDMQPTIIEADREVQDEKL